MGKKSLPSPLEQLENVLEFCLISKSLYSDPSIRTEIKRLRPDGEDGKQFNPDHCYDKLKLASTSAGFGIKAKEKIKRGECIGEYVGVIKRFDLEDTLSDYSMDLMGSFIIDAEKKGNVTRYINHSCQPNLLVELQWIGSECSPFFFAKRDIKKDEELTYQYRYQYQKGAKQKVCKCGAVECVGWMGILPNEKRERLQCEVCKKLFSFRQGLDTHMLTHQENRARFKCNKCGQTFAFPTGLSRHDKEKHKKTKSLFCKGCQKRFHRPYVLIAHEKDCKMLKQMLEK